MHPISSYICRTSSTTRKGRSIGWEGVATVAETKATNAEAEVDAEVEAEVEVEVEVEA